MTEGNPAEEVRKLLARMQGILPEFNGIRVEKAVELARQLGIDLRVIQLHEDAWYTSDLRHDRVTIEVENGLVTSARIA